MFEDFTWEWNEESWGITHKSLLNLRSSILDGWQDEIDIVSVCSDKEREILGYAIINKTRETITYTGDGFRTDFKGEGGAGYKTAHAFLSILGIKRSRLEIFPVIEDETYIETDIFKQRLQNMLEDNLEDLSFFIPREIKTVEYLRDI